ncbi:MAG: polar amino acid transport system substrate-binding protein [Thermotogaceae bacterium]|jgi:polar amino acid transport system substrate-binding protein|nr:polar amino acid transport system substrate-binding protein [Thermotogaceae bacterium]
MKKYLLIGFLTLAMLAMVFSNAPFKIYTELIGRSQFYDEEGTLTGSSVEIVREIQKRVGDDTEIEPLPWSRAYNLLQSEDNIILFSTTLTEERRPMFQWVGPIFSQAWVFYVKKGSGVEINSMEDAKKLEKIGTYLNDARELYLKSLGFENLDSAVDESNNIKKLDVGRVDAVISSPDNFVASCKKAGIEVNNFEEAYLVSEQELYITFSKNFDKTIVAEWQEALKSMYEDGTFEEIYLKWYPNARLPTYKVVE